MTSVDLEPVRDQVAILRWAVERKKELAEVEKMARDAVEAAMGNHDLGLLDDQPAVQWPTFKENRFDSAAFRADHPDLWEQYKAAREKRRFEVLSDD